MCMCGLIEISLSIDYQKLIKRSYWLLSDALQQDKTKMQLSCIWHQIYSAFRNLSWNNLKCRATSIMSPLWFFQHFFLFKILTENYWFQKTYWINFLVNKFNMNCFWQISFQTFQYLLNSPFDQVVICILGVFHLIL